MKGRIMSGLITTVLMLVFGLGSASAQQTYRAPFLGSDDLIPGLGEQVPTSPNVSLSDNVRVYKFEKNGITFVQINTLNDEVLTAIGLTGRDSFVLPIGMLSSEQVQLPSRGNPATRGGFETTSATCPCSAQVVYQDQYATIVVIYGAGGEVIEVVVIYHTEAGPIEP